MLLANFTARSGLIAQQQRLDTIANNLANVNTLGYKSVRTDFKDMIYQTQVRVEQPQDDLNLQRGHGVLFGANTRDFRNGAQQYTGYNLDVYLSGDGFITVQNSAGENRYTRDGSFSISPEDDGNYLVSQSGHYVLDLNGERINVYDAQPDDIAIDANWNVSIKRYYPETDTTPAREEYQNVGTLAIVHIPNSSGLEAVSGNLFAITENSGEPVAEIGTKTIQGSIEMSNVEVATEMVRMIRTQRAYSLAGRVFTTADEMDARAIQIRG